MLRRIWTVAVALAAVSAPTPAQFSLEPAPDSVVRRCRDCGIIESVRETQQMRNDPAMPDMGGRGPVGLVIYVPTGERSRDAKPYVGAVGTREWQNLATKTTYEYSVRMDDGGYRFVQREGGAGLQIGDRVRVSGGRIERWAPEAGQ